MSNFLGFFFFFLPSKLRKMEETIYSINFNGILLILFVMKVHLFFLFFFFVCFFFFFVCVFVFELNLAIFSLLERTQLRRLATTMSRI
jgi:hypothetical protein